MPKGGRALTHLALVESLYDYHADQARRLVFAQHRLGSFQARASTYPTSGCPTPDVLTIQASYTRPIVTAYECKVTRADFRSDVRSGKWQAYAEFSHRLFWAAPRGLLKPEDLPEGTGLVQLGETGGWRARVAAPLRKARDFTWEEWMSLLLSRREEQRHQGRELQRRLGARHHDLHSEALTFSAEVQNAMHEKRQWQAVKDDVRALLGDDRWGASLKSQARWREVAERHLRERFDLPACGGRLPEEEDRG